MRKHRYIALTALFALVVSACSNRRRHRHRARPRRPRGRVVLGRSVGRAQRVRRCRQPHRPRAGSGRGGHHGRRGQRRDRLLDVLPVADLRPVHQGHDRPLRGDLSGRHGQVGRPPGDLPGRPQQRLRRRHRARRHQPLGQRGLGQRLRGQGPAPRPQQRRPEARPGHLLPGPLERAADRRRELPVPVVPGPQRRADQQEDLRGRRRPERRRLPEDDRRAAGHLPDDQGQDRHAVRHPPDGQRPAVADGLRGRRRRHQ